MKITMYELLGMVKDDKAPKKIKHSGTIYLFDNDINWYADEDGYYCLDSDHRYINDIIEIIEDTLKEEKKIPEKLEEFDIQGLEVSGYSMSQAEYLLEDGVKENREMINWILDYLKSKGE
jgi:hypothetical protein